MGKREYLEQLRACLEGIISPRAMEDNLLFYEQYFEEQMGMGKTESQISASLGAPSILAHSLVEAARRNGDAYAAGAEETRYYSVDEEEETTGKKGRVRANLPGWLIFLLILLILFGVLYFAGALLVALWPVLLPALVVFFVVRLLRHM